MKLHREVLKRARKLGTVDVALIESGRRDARTLEEIGKLSDADSLRQAYFDFGVVTPPKSHGPSTIDDNRGTGKPQPIADPEEALAARQNQHVMNLPASWWTLKPCWIPDACRW